MRAVLLLLLGVASLWWMASRQSRESMIVGQWHDSRGGSFTFFDRGYFTAVADEGMARATGSYRFVDASHVSFAATGEAAPEFDGTCGVEIRGDHMMLSDVDGRTVRLTRFQP